LGWIEARAIEKKIECTVTVIHRNSSGAMC
jgi:hypothetical protein